MSKELSKNQICFINDNIGRMSVKNMAKHLGVDKRLVSEFVKKPRPASKAKTDPRKLTAIHIAVIFVVALLVRLIYLQQLSHTYFFAPFKGGFDDYMFDNWAREILGGNWLDDRVLYIYRMPLYGYILALIYFIFGAHVWPAYMINALVGAASCVLIYFIAKSVFNKTTGIIAGLINAFSGALLFYTGVLVGEIFGIFILCLAALALLEFEKTRGNGWLFGAGLLIGLSLLIKGSIVAALPLIIIWVFFLLRKAGLPKSSMCAAILLAGALIPVACIGARNYIYEKDIVPVTAQGGLTFYIGNAYGSDGKYHNVKKLGSNQKQMLLSSIKIAEEHMGRKLKPSEVSSFWVGETIRSMKSHGIGYLVPLLAKKFAYFWNAYEIPDIWDYYFIKRFVPLLRLPLFSFLIVAPLAVTGMYMSWRDRRRAALLYIFILGTLLSLMTAFMTSRYRIQVFPFMAIFAAYTIAGAKDLLKDRKRLGAAAAILAAAAIFTVIPIEKLSFETSYNSLGIILKREGKIEEALQAYNKAIEIAPGYPTPYYNLGILYRDRGESGQAATYFRKAVELAPYFTDAQRELERLGGAGSEE